MCCRLKEISKNGCNVDSIWYLSVMLQLWYQLTWYCWYWLKIANCALKLFLLTTWMYWLSEDSSTEWMIGFILLISLSKTIQFVSIYYNLRNHFNVSMYCATWFFLSQNCYMLFLIELNPVANSAVAVAVHFMIHVWWYVCMQNVITEKTLMTGCASWNAKWSQAINIQHGTQLCGDGTLYLKYICISK